ncbi:MAG: hypothetical protein LBI28_11245 [Treponema sp.]|jgi:hypothetical protein|nr:hypothetical protein [Treponema sp.]
MTLDDKSTTVTDADIFEFGEVVDKACKGLMDKQIKYSIRRIQEMEDTLSELERELDAFLGDFK